MPNELKLAVFAVKTIEMAVPAVSQGVLAVPIFLTSAANRLRPWLFQNKDMSKPWFSVGFPTKSS